MKILKGTIANIDELIIIIKSAITHMESKKFYQWDDIYPNKEVLKNDILENNLYIFYDENIIKGFMVLNEFQDEEYKEIPWECTTGKPIIIHRLCINPNYQGTGIAKNLLNFATEFALLNNYSSIRLDAFIPNITACKLYEKNLYIKRGVVTFRKGNFYCFEKILDIK